MIVLWLEEQSEFALMRLKIVFCDNFFVPDPTADASKNFAYRRVMQDHMRSCSLFIKQIYILEKISSNFFRSLSCLMKQKRMYGSPRCLCPSL